MIVVQLAGGLGNQLFQYAAGRALAERHGVQLRLDLRALHNRNTTDTPRSYALAPFAVTGSLASWLDLRVIAIQERVGIAAKLKEVGHGYNAAFDQAGHRIYLEGYWQTERYFTSIEPTIRQEFRLLSSLSQQNAALLDAISGGNAISVHVRRGDYASNPVTNAYHGLIGLEYYTAAAERIIGEVSDAHFYVFSDDQEWAHSNLRLPGPMTFVGRHTVNDAHEDLRLMSACQHHIIANSSFSWWGAWLSDRPGKVVIAPRSWFRDSTIDTSDVCPSTWIRLS